MRYTLEVRSTPRYRLLCNWFPAASHGGLASGVWPGITQVPRSRVKALYIVITITVILYYKIMYHASNLYMIIFITFISVLFICKLYNNITLLVTRGNKQSSWLAVS